MRISTTTLETYRLWRRGRVDEAQLIASIKGEVVATPRIRIGRAYGRILEQPDTYRVAGGSYFCDGYRFAADVVDPALARIDRRGFFEVKGTKTYGAHTVVAKADHVLGARLDEFKTRIGAVHVERYAESYQWRFLADVFEALQVTYRVFRLSEDPFALEAIEELPLYRYAQLQADCRQLVEQFVDYVRRHRLEAHLRDRVHELAPPAIELGPAFEDAPTRPSPAPRLRALREQCRAKKSEGNFRDFPSDIVRHEEDRALPLPPCTLPPLKAIVDVPASSFELWPTRPRLQQASLF